MKLCHEMCSPNEITSREIHYCSLLPKSHPLFTCGVVISNGDSCMIAIKTLTHPPSQTTIPNRDGQRT